MANTPIICSLATPSLTVFSLIYYDEAHLSVLGCTYASGGQRALRSYGHGPEVLHQMGADTDSGLADRVAPVEP